jgi:hypothetical protein
MDHKQQLSIISKLWGDQDGYVFFPWIDGGAKTKEERIASWNEGMAFHWPEDRTKILEHMGKHEHDDLYWCPTIFEEPRRIQQWAMDHHGLWADLDEIDPRELDDFGPSYAWESSPGRYQGIWILEGARRLNIADRGAENHRLTYYLGADRSGWDMTQLMRIPGWANHKPDYKKKYGKPPVGRLLRTSELQNSRRIWDIAEFDDLPPVEGSEQPIEMAVLEEEISKIDRHEVYARVRLKLHTDVRELISSREASGDRSDVLWRLERDLADTGCTAAEIVSILRPTVWNKFEGRSDEMHRLLTEATKAVAARPQEITQELEQDLEAKPEPEDFDTLMDTAKPPLWLVRNIWPQATVGFIAGQPKSWKSWTALDLALSISTGAPFLGHFRVERPGPVLYIQEEDGASLIKLRYGRMRLGKKTDSMIYDREEEQVVWVPPDENQSPPKMKAMVRRDFVLSEPGWQSWLDDQLTKGYIREGADADTAEPYVLLVLDPLLMMVGEIEENKASAMNAKIYKPLKLLANKHGVAIVIVHHMRKGSNEGIRGGQMMLGSAATHGASESAMYFTHDKGGLHVEVEHKNAIGGSFRLGNIKNKRWEPHVMKIDLSGAEGAALSPGEVDDNSVITADEVANAAMPKSTPRGGRPKGGGIRGGKALQALGSLGGNATVRDITELTGQSAVAVNAQLSRALDKGLVTKIAIPGANHAFGKQPNLWTLASTNGNE